MSRDLAQELLVGTICFIVLLLNESLGIFRLASVLVIVGPIMMVVGLVGMGEKMRREMFTIRAMIVNINLSDSPIFELMVILLGSGWLLFCVGLITTLAKKQ